MEDSEPPKLVVRTAHLACESVIASSSKATVDSKVECGLSPAKLNDGGLNGGGSPLL